MKIWKKLLMLCMTLALGCGVLGTAAACGGDSGDNGGNSGSGSSVESSAPESESSEESTSSEESSESPETNDYVYRVTVENETGFGFRGLSVSLYDGETLIGTVSLIEHDDLDGLPVWSESVKPAVLVRPGVTPALQHRGWGTKMLAYALKAAWERGADSVRLLCGTENKNAFSMYRRAGFEVRGEAEMYGRRYFCMERMKRSGE